MWVATNEGEPLHTVTIRDPDRTDSIPTVWRFESGSEAYGYARTTKTKWSHLEVTVTDEDNRTVEIKENGWSLVHA